MPIKPKISVCIPTYNASDLLRRAVNSVLNQNFEGLEILIIDDHSNSSNWEKTYDWYKKEDRVKLIRNDVNLGLENWNRCIELSKGDYILILHHDDEMLPGMIQKTVSFLDNNPGVGLVHTNGYNIADHGKSLLRITQNKAILKAGTEALLKSLTNHNYICSSVVVRRECYGTGFITDNPSPDLEMYARIARDYDLGHISEPLVKCYIRFDSSGNQILLKEDPDSIESKWLESGEKIISYFPKGEQDMMRLKFNQAMVDGLWIAGAVSWRKKHWKRGHEFFIKASNYMRSLTFVKRYFLEILKTPVLILFYRFRG